MHVPLHVNIEIHRCRSMFLEAPKEALTVKVGPGDTAARPDVLYDMGAPHIDVLPLQNMCPFVIIFSPWSSYRDFLTCWFDPLRKFKFEFKRLSG